MDYLLGSLVTILAIMYAAKSFSFRAPKRLKLRIDYSQTRALELSKPLNLFNQIIETVTKKRISQTIKHWNSVNIRVIIAEYQAYWIANNKFYVADVDRNNHMVNQDSAKEVDTMTMDDVQLKRISEIVELLRKDTDDSSNTGEQSFW